MAKVTRKVITTGDEEIQIQSLIRHTINLRIIGTTAMFQNRMSAKTQQYLLAGGGKKTRVEKMAIKHHPLKEYQDSAETMSSGPTALGLRVTAVKSAMSTAALETAGLTMTSSKRLIFIEGTDGNGELAPLYGIPKLRMDVVRSADMNKTPDIRTRAFLEKWGCELTIQYIAPQLSGTSIVTLLHNAGLIIGVGDYRQEKGKGNFGLWRVVGQGEKDEEWDDLVANHGRMRQMAALAHPEYAGSETESLMAWYEAETKRRAAA